MLGNPNCSKRPNFKPGNRKIMTNGIEEKYIKLDEIQIYLDKG